MDSGSFRFFFQLDASYSDRDRLYQDIAKQLHDLNKVVVSYGDELTKRESEFPTGLETRYCNVAIPHTNSEFVEEPFIYFIRLNDTLDFKEMSGSGVDLPVKLVFILGITDNRNQVVLLSNIMNFLMDEKHVRECLTLTHPPQIEALIRREILK